MRGARYNTQHVGWRFRNLRQWTKRVEASGQRRSPFPLTYITAISFWSINRDCFAVNRPTARQRLVFKRTEKRRK